MNPAEWTDDFRRLSHKTIRSVYSNFHLLLISLHRKSSSLQAGLSFTTSRFTISIPPVLYHSSTDTDMLSQLPPSIHTENNQPVELMLQDILIQESYYACPLRKTASLNQTIDERISIGRSSDQDILLRDKTISKTHAWITIDLEGTVLLTDASSKNGTKVNNLTIEPGQIATLRTGDQIMFGQVKCIFTSSEPLWLALQT